MEGDRYIRQPIVLVSGHVDHGKTTLLDRIRGTTVTIREAGAITQHIGATEVPIQIIHDLCGQLLGDRSFDIPGLLFIDTPGHHAFTTLRARGGALADIAVVVIDINDGLMPQSIEAIDILKKYRTPFVVAINKIDTLQGWNQVAGCITDRLQQQQNRTKQLFEKKFYNIVESLYDQEFPSNRFDRIRDFRKNIALIPISAKSGEGVAELLMVLVGLAQRFLEENLVTENRPAEGTVLEVKEEKGLGTTIDVIIYSGTIRAEDTFAVAGKHNPIVTSVRALLKPRPLDEIRDPSEHFSHVREASAATGIKIAAPGLEDVFAGAPLKVIGEDMEETLASIKNEMKIDIETEDEGIIVKADAIGSLEALAHLLKGVPIRKADVGTISKKDVVEAKTNENPVNRVVLGFNVKTLPEAENEARSAHAFIISHNVIHSLLDDFETWKTEKACETEECRRRAIIHPGKMLFIPDCIFRVSKPAVIGVRVLAGEIRPGQQLMRDDGKVIGALKSIQHENRTVDRAGQGQEVAVAVEGVTVGRQIKPDMVLYVDLPQDAISQLVNMPLSPDEHDVLESVIKIKRKCNRLD